MAEENKRAYWAVYEHEDVLNIWVDGKLVAEIPKNEFPHMILQMAKCLKNSDS